MKKAISLVMALVLCLSLLAGCGGAPAASSASSASPAASSAAPAPKSNKPVELTLGIWNQRQMPAMEALSAEYNKLNPEVKITVQSTPSKGNEYWTKMQAAAAGGTAPDIFWMNTVNLLTFANAGMLLPLEDTIKANAIDLASYPPALVSMYNVDGKMYALPKDFDTNAVWYNKSIFDAANVPYPTDDWTWEDMVYIAQKLTDPAKGVYGIAAPISEYQTTYYNTIAAAGGYVLSEDKKTVGFAQQSTQDGIQCWIDLISQKISPDLATLTDTSADTLFESGKLAMVWAGSYMTNEYVNTEGLTGKIDCVKLPTFKGNTANVINGLSYAIYAKSKNIEAAQKFLAWVVGEEGMKVQGEFGFAIAAHTGAQQYFEKAYPDYNIAAYTSQASIATPLPISPVTPQLNDLQIKYLKLVGSGAETVKSACDKIAAEGNALLAK